MSAETGAGGAMSSDRFKPWSVGAFIQRTKSGECTAIFYVDNVMFQIECGQDIERAKRCVGETNHALDIWDDDKEPRVVDVD